MRRSEALNSRQAERLIEIGQVFGLRTIIGNCFRKERSRLFVRCRCKCGIEQDVRVETLLSGGARACKDCASKNRSDSVPIHLGQIFGNFTIIDEPYFIRGKGRSVRVRCKCGEEKGVKVHDLLADRSGCRYCPATSVKIELGQVFGDRKVIDICGPLSGPFYALTECKCGRKLEIPKKVLLDGKWQRCKFCAVEFRANKVVNNRSLQRQIFAEIPRTVWKTIVKNAASRAFEFAITPEEVWQLYIGQGRKCALTGVPIGFRESTTRDHSASLDRIDSSKGYLLDNVQWVHKRINIMKSNMTEPEFIAFCYLVLEHNGFTVQKL